MSTPSSLPSSASVDLPPIHVHADYRQHGASSDDSTTTSGAPGGGSSDAEAELTEGLVLREGSYLNAIAEVGTFEHSLTTDLLNHLVFVQKVFMKVKYRDHFVIKRRYMNTQIIIIETPTT